MMICIWVFQQLKYLMMILASNVTPVMLTDEQAALFVLFMKHYDKIGFMISQGCFDIAHGSAIVNFDKFGNISSVERRLFSYPKKDMV